MPKKRKTNTFKIIAIVFLSLCLVGAIALAIAARWYLNNIKPVAQSSREVAFTIREGDTMEKIIDELYKEGLIQNKLATQIFTKINHRNSYYAGNYLLNRSWSNEEIFDWFADQDHCIQDEVEIKISDGYWARDIAHILAEYTNLNETEIMNKWNNPYYIDELMQQYECLSEDMLASEHCYLEGYLMPDTYRFFKNTTIEQVTEKMLDQTEAFYQANKADFEQSRFSKHEVFTLASIIQFESGNPNDNPVVSSVFYNRLDEGMKLQSSVTVCYALYDYESGAECELSKNLNNRSKYNTYQYEGLPIGPICNPNAAAMDAALHPAQSDYFYFIGFEGKTYFSRTYAEHLQLVERYLN